VSSSDAEPARGVPVTLSLTAGQHEALRRHLYPGDGLEAAAILLCGRRAGRNRHRLVVREVHGIPYSKCHRTPVAVNWQTDSVASLFDRAANERWSVVKVHSHPTGHRAFSPADDAADGALLRALRGYVEHDIPHGSAIMLPGGELIGRILWGESDYAPICTIAIVGPDLHFWHASSAAGRTAKFAASHAQAFGEGTFERLSRLSIAVVGCSGTGGPVAEQLARLGVARLTLVDDDFVEERNLNRMPHATAADARSRRLKVEVVADAIRRAGLGTEVVPIARNLWDPNAVLAVAECDIVFGCMDTAEGRFLLNTLATWYTLPYFDLGVRLDAVPEGPDRGRIREVCGTVHYLPPGGSSLMSRGLVSMDRVKAEGLRRLDPATYQRELQDGYIRGVAVDRPAVISLNMFAASLAVNDFLARLHPYREQPNSEIGYIEFSLSSTELFPEPEGEPCPMLCADVGRGDQTPLLGLPALADRSGK